MAYTPSLRHLSLLFTLPLGFFVGSVITHLKLQGAALATSPLREGGVEPEEEAVRRAAIEQKKRNWRSGIVGLLLYLLFLAAVTYGADSWPNLFSATAIVFHTGLFAYISRTVLLQLFGNSTVLLSRPNDGTLLQQFSTPFTLSSAPLSLLALALFPCTILFPSFLPTFIVLSFVTVILFSQNLPFSVAKDAAVSLRWTFVLFLGIELLTLFVGLAFGLAIKEGLLDAFGSWLEESFKDGSAVAAAEEVKVVVEIEPFLGNLILEGFLFLQPFIWFMTTGWLLTILYRLDVHILEGKNGNSLVGLEEYGRSDSTVTFFKGETGQKISLPPLRSSIKRHLKAAISSPPTYFLTGIIAFVSLLLLSPIILAYFEHRPLVEVHGLGSSSRQAAELETTGSLAAVILAPWAIATAVGIVALFKGEGKLVWNYREVWGESKVAAVGGGEVEKLLEEGEESSVDEKR